MKSVLRGVSWALFAIAGLTFWVGGTAIAEYAKTDRILSEMLGLMSAAALGGIGLAVKSAADDLEPDEDPPAE
jgi:hypothetical protein